MEKAKDDGVTIMSVSDAESHSDFIMVLLPDESQAVVYKDSIEPNLKAGNALVFAHGFNIHYSQIVPPTDVDVFLVAPKGPGHLVRRTFEDGAGVPALYGVYKDVTGNARQLALSASFVY